MMHTPMHHAKAMLLRSMMQACTVHYAWIKHKSDATMSQSCTCTVLLAQLWLRMGRHAAGAPHSALPGKGLLGC